MLGSGHDVIWAVGIDGGAWSRELGSWVTGGICGRAEARLSVERLCLIEAAMASEDGLTTWVLEIHGIRTAEDCGQLR